MKIKGTALALALALLAGGAGRGADQKSSLKEYSSSKGGFKVLMPGEVTTSSREEKNPIMGKVQYHMYLGSSSDAIYLVMYTDFPAFVINAGKPEDLLENAGNGYVKGIGGKVVKQEKVSLGKYPGREYFINAPDKGLNVRARIFLVNRRIYFLNVMSKEKEATTSKEAKDFLGSFKLLDQK